MYKSQKIRSKREFPPSDKRHWCKIYMLNFLPPGIRDKARTSPTMRIQHCVVILESAIRQEKEKTRHVDWKGRSETSLFTGDMIFYGKSYTSYQKKKLLEITRTFNKFAGYKANVSELTAFLHTRNKHMEILILNFKSNIIL